MNQRELRSAAEIQQEVSRHVAAVPAIAAAKSFIVVPLPRLTNDDPSGCNWTMTFGGAAVRYAEEIEGCLLQVQAKFNVRM